MSWDDLEDARLKSDAHYLTMNLFRTDNHDWWDEYAWNWLKGAGFRLGMPFSNTREWIRQGYEIERWVRRLFWKSSMGKLGYFPDAKGRLRKMRLPGRIYPRKKAEPTNRFLNHHSNIEVPKIWKGPGRDTTGAFAMATMPIGGKIDGVVLRTRPWLPIAESPDQVYASEYSAECARLQVSEAGRKARRILLDHLSDGQVRDYFNRGMFTVKPPKVENYAYTIVRGFPNGNVYKTKGRRVLSNYCCHPASPHAIDDIILTQKLLLENDEEAFLKTANAGAYREKHRVTVDDIRFDRAYEVPSQ